MNFTLEQKAVIMKWFADKWDSATMEECAQLVEDLISLGMLEEAEVYARIMDEELGLCLKDKDVFVGTDGVNIDAA